MSLDKMTSSRKWPRKSRKIEKAWTPSDITKIIKLVKEQELLWDPSLPGYKDSKLRETTFQEIAETLDRTPTDCKAKWDNLRAQYRSYQAKTTQNLPVKWQYFDAIKFLSKVCEPRKSKFNMVLLPPSGTSDQFLEDSHSNSYSSSTHLTIKEEEEHHNLTDEVNGDNNAIIKDDVISEHNYNSAKIFGDFVADQMRQLKQHIADELKKNILKLVVQALEQNS